MNPQLLSSLAAEHRRDLDAAVTGRQRGRSVVIVISATRTS